MQTLSPSRAKYPTNSFMQLTCSMLTSESHRFLLQSSRVHMGIYLGTSFVPSHLCSKQTFTLLYLLVLVVAGWLLVGKGLYVPSGRALGSVGAGYWTVLLTHIPTTGTRLWWYKPAGQKENRARMRSQTSYKHWRTLIPEDNNRSMMFISSGNYSINIPRGRKCLNALINLIRHLKCCYDDDKAWREYEAAIVSVCCLFSHIFSFFFFLQRWNKFMSELIINMHTHRL